MIHITVPATSANIGAGFDSLGLALNLQNEIYMEEWDLSLIHICISSSSSQWYCCTNFLRIRGMMTYPPPKVKALRVKVEENSFQ